MGRFLSTNSISLKDIEVCLGYIFLSETDSLCLSRYLSISSKLFNVWHKVHYFLKSFTICIICNDVTSNTQYCWCFRSLFFSDWCY